MGSITRLCKRAISLQDGQIVDDGPAAAVVRKYVTSGQTQTGYREWYASNEKPGDKIVQLLAVRAKDANGNIIEELDIRNLVEIEMEFEVLEAGHNLLPHFVFFNELGVNIMNIVDLDKEWQYKNRPRGIYNTKVTVPGNFFSECTVSIHANMVSPETAHAHFIVPNAVAFQVFDTLTGESSRGEYVGSINSVVRPAFMWHTEYKFPVES